MVSTVDDVILEIPFQKHVLFIARNTNLYPHDEDIISSLHLEFQLTTGTAYEWTYAIMDFRQGNDGPLSRLWDDLHSSQTFPEPRNHDTTSKVNS